MTSYVFTSMEDKAILKRPVVRQHRSPELVDRGYNAKSFALIFRSWVWARYCSMKF